MNTATVSYKRHRFPLQIIAQAVLLLQVPYSRDRLYRRHRLPAEIIAHTVWLYLRFPLSLRMVEDMLAARGIRI
ncbi:hypothetical protein GCM10007880_63150 [Mesorhizobium amorphae]|nr:hypothetical protein GCM10007880_63150 [Mesorhizobium amorphae]